jgi:hypothetical protein
MNRLKLYQWSVALLLALNLATLLYVLKRSPNHDDEPAKDRRIMLLKDLNLSDENFSKVEEFARLHHQKILELNRLEQGLIYQALTQNENLSEYDNQICKIENQKIEVTRKHFYEIENLLDDRQKEAFISIKVDLIRALFLTKRPRRPRPIN